MDQYSGVDEEKATEQISISVSLLVCQYISLPLYPSMSLSLSRSRSCSLARLSIRPNKNEMNWENKKLF